MSTQRAPRCGRPQYLRGILLLGVLYCGLVAIYLLATPFLWSRKSLLRAATSLSRVVLPFSLWIAGVRIRSYGEQHLKGITDSPFILVSNHGSMIDTIVQMKVLNRVDLSYFAKKEFLDRPVAGRLGSAMGWLSVDRKSPFAMKRLKEQVEERKKTGWVPRLVIFPEGTRTRDGKLQPLRSGAFLLAIQLGIPLLPMVMCGTHAVQAQNLLAVRPGPVDVYVSEPIYPPSNVSDPEQLFAAANDLKDQVETIFRRHCV